MKLTVKTSFESTQTQREIINTSMKAAERETRLAVRHYKRDDETALYEVTEAGRAAINAQR